MIAHGVADQLRVIDRAVASHTRSTEALLRATDETALLRDICRIAVDVAGYGLAWVGYARPDDAKSVEPVAAAGRNEGYLHEIMVSWSEGGQGHDPIAQAIRSGITQVVRDIAKDPRTVSWREVALRHGFRSMVALPLGPGCGHVGALNIYAAELDAFDADVLRLLEDLTRNLSYGVGALRVKAEHVQAVRDLAESEERYRSLVELTPDAILVHSQGTILFANPAAERVFEVHHLSLEGANLLEFVHPDSQRLLAGRIATPPRERQLTEYRMKRPDGSGFDAEIVATTITFHGLPATIMVIRDITQRKMVQEQLVQAAKLATLGEMAAGLVHELSQPLNIIRLTAEGALLFIERGKATPEWQAEQFELVAHQAQRTAEIIDDIRVFSRRDSGPVQAFDALGAVRSAVAVLLGQFVPDDISLVCDLPSQPVAVRGRRVQLEQVVMNLLSNAHHAIKDMRERHAPGERAPGQVRVSGRTVGNSLVITVADSGPGIPPAMRARIFEPFFTTKEAGRGTGLGLSVSFGIIVAMGGQLEVSDLPQGGACFTISLPVDEAAVLPGEGMPVVPICAPAPIDGHIMVVEDEAPAAETLALYLRELGYRASVCTSGNEAYDCFMRDPADVVITDLRMPEGGGEQLVERLRDFDPLLPIIIVTGHLGATERLSANLQDDRCVLLKKPVALSALGDIIVEFLKPPAGGDDDDVDDDDF